MIAALCPIIHTNNVGITQSVYDLVMHQEWTSVLHRARQFPQEICRHRNCDGKNVLHLACRFPNVPLYFFQHLYDIHPQNFQTSLSCVDAYHGVTPLLVACSNRLSLHVIDY
jgi:hypothetical protein